MFLYLNKLLYACAIARLVRCFCIYIDKVGTGKDNAVAGVFAVGCEAKGAGGGLSLKPTHGGLGCTPLTFIFRKIGV